MRDLEIEFIFYIAAWASLCLCALWLYLKDRGSFAFSYRSYRQFLMVRWKVVTFLCAAIGITVVAPYTGDPTWDYFDAPMMSILTFVSAPWAIGALYLVVRRQLDLKQGLVAVCVWMFSASWCYDLYLVFRDGHYPFTWFPNIFASSALYIAAGLLWNLEWKAGRGATFSFLEAGWPSPPVQPGFLKVFWYALPFMLIAGCAIGYFLIPNTFP